MGNNHSELLKDKKVVEEINRYKWVESEKVGHDIGLEKASRDWLDNHAEAWIAQYSNKKPVAPNKPKKSFREL